MAPAAATARAASLCFQLRVNRMHVDGLRRFQESFVREATRPGIDTAVLSCPRGNGKSWIAGHLVARALTPRDPLHVPGGESVLVSGSIEQCRIVYRAARAILDAGPHAAEYRYVDSATRVGISHRPSATRLRVLGSAAKRAMGFVDVPLVIADEPGVYDVASGQLMHDAIMTARGKPGSPLRAIYVGTIAPATIGWWPELVERGSHRSTYVMHLAGDPETWDSWPTIRKANPLTAVSADFRRKLLEERDEARRDTRLKARFLSYRLNVPSGDESTMLLTVDDWQAVLAREVPARAGRPIVGVDLGSGRAWSAAVAMYSSGRVEALAIAPGLPSIDEQEKRDRVPRTTYSRLVEAGSLHVAEGLRVQPPGQLWAAVCATWGRPARVLCDYFRLPELKDVVRAEAPIFPRRPLWSTAAEDIRGVRRLAKDGPLSCAPESRGLLTASLAAALVKNDEHGNVRMVKRGTNGEARDDVVAALCLSAGSLERELAKPAATFPSYVVA